MPARLSSASARGVARAVRPRTVPAALPVSHAVTVAASSRCYAAAAAPPLPLGRLQLPEDYIPPTQPPTARRPESRKSQLLRAYTAMLRSSPLMLFFQHSNLTAVEWSAVRRELRKSLQELPVPEPRPDGTTPPDISSAIQLQVLRTRIFDVSFKICEFFDAEAAAAKPNAYTHDLSQAAYDAIKAADVKNPSTTYAQISPLLSGPIAALTFPAVSPAHLGAALRILAPSAPHFPAPTRRKSPGFHDPVAQSGLQKLLLVGGRVEGKAFDQDGIKWVGGIEAGIDGLRAQLVTMLQSAGLGLTTALEGQSKGLWLALESRRTQMDEEQNPKKAEEDTPGA